MNRQQFQKQFGAEYKAFIESPCGQASLNILAGLAPAYEFPKEEHLLTENRGAKRGYEACLRNQIALSLILPLSTEIPADYGVPEIPKQDK